MAYNPNLAMLKPLPLEKDIETIYDVVAPGKSVDFKTKYFAPRKTDSIGIKVLGAKTK